MFKLFGNSDTQQMRELGQALLQAAEKGEAQKAKAVEALDQIANGAAALKSLLQ